ncbi:MAG: alanine:cation symporter family protein [Myxococcales bacterium]|nr:alanine:cation symporter family protein [Myxococcales bacterium]
MAVLLCVASWAGLGHAQEGPEAAAESAPLVVEASETADAAAAPATKAKPELDFEGKVNAFFGKWFVTPIGKVFFVDLMFWDNDSATDIQLPMLVVWLVLGACFFTIRMGFINVRGLRHAVEIVRGKYYDPNDVGEVSHFQALTAALSATVGLGNIAGVAVAITIGGPGATFWMITAGFLGMASKFAECTLGQKYRTIEADGTVLGGPMQYLSRGLAEMNYPTLGKVLAVFFVILCIFGSFAGGNAFQVNQSLGAIEQKVIFLQDNHWIYGAVMTTFVGVVIVGGIQRIATIAEAIVPLMCGIYVTACLYILLANAGAVPEAMSSIVLGAFSTEAGIGGFVGVLMVGFKRAAFSNEAGVGSAAIAHSAAKSAYPVQEGLVALLEPLVDTIIVCTMTALVIVITGAWNNPEWADLIANKNGAGLTSQAMGAEISWFPWVLAVAVALFAFSTMISWSYYGERCWTWLFGSGTGMYYRGVFLVFTFMGALMTGTTVLDFGDLMILGMALPNVFGVIMLSGKVKNDLDDYLGMLKSGEVKPRA